MPPSSFDGNGMDDLPPPPFGKQDFPDELPKIVIDTPPPRAPTPPSARPGQPPPPAAQPPRPVPAPSFGSLDVDVPPSLDDLDGKAAEDDIPDTLFSDILQASPGNADVETEELLQEDLQTNTGADLPPLPMFSPSRATPPSPAGQMAIPAPEQSFSEQSLSELSQVDTSQPLFISAQGYNDILRDVSTLSGQIKKFEDTFARIYTFKLQQNDSFDNWRKSMEFLHKKLSAVDDIVYAKKGEKQ